MTEDDAVRWIDATFGTAAAARLRVYVDLLIQANTEQNLVSASTLPNVWSRHIVDSAQLVRFAPRNGTWLDIGSGAGLPGIVVAIVTDRPVLLCEPRAKRVAFLGTVIDALDLNKRVRVVPAKVQALLGETEAAVISARAVAALPALFEATRKLTTDATTWVLPRGPNARSEVADARRLWQGVFHVERSITDPRSGIVIARGVRPR